MTPIGSAVSCFGLHKVDFGVTEWDQVRVTKLVRELKDVMLKENLVQP